MSRVDDQQQLIFVTGLYFDLRVLHATNEPDLHAILQHHVENFFRMSRADGYRNTRVLGGETLQNQWQKIGADGRGRSERQATSQSFAQLAERRLPLAEGPHGPLR